MNTAVDRFVRTPLVRRSAYLTFVLAVAAVIFQGIAEQGGLGSELSPVPQQPLPFSREQHYGVDLSDRPSLEAVRWLEISGSANFGLVYYRVDADIIGALRNENSSANALRALDRLIDSARESNIAICLERPVTEIADDLLAELTIDVLRDRYPDQIAYVAACTSSEPSWAAAIASQVRAGSPATPDRLTPLLNGATVILHMTDGFDDIDSARLRSFAGDRYAIPVIPVETPPDPADVGLVADAIQDAAQIALVLLRPDADVDPLSLVQTMATPGQTYDRLPEGFTGVTSPAVQFGGQWEFSQVGRVVYQRTTTAGSTLQTSFTGTTIYLQALLSPDAGVVSVWIDPDVTAPGPPDREIDLSAIQARDAAVVLAENLAADDHTLIVVTNDGDVTVSGLFVSGQPAAGWNAGLATVAMIAIASVSLAIIGLARVQDIRDRDALPPRQSAESVHPRAYSRDR